MKAVLDVLVALDELEWARCVGGDEPLRPPYVAWRFKIPDKDVEMRIVDAVNTYNGPTEWTISKGRRNWVIGPLAFEKFAKDFRVDVEASRQFGRKFPSETRKALSDASVLAGHLRKVLLPH
ncbi:MAG TPA: hypothetical protein VER96_22865 [Polyangiaceae bacterium]|nr:hypothetical protein [Polyangiaceae bacterium]